MANFKFIGTIAAIKESEKFKPINVIEKDNGKFKSISFSARCGADSHIVTMNSWTPKAKRTEIYTLKQKAGSKPEKYTVKWEDRKKESVLAVIPDYKKYIIDINPAGYISGLEHLVDDFKDGSATDEKMSKYQVASLDEAKAALAKAKAGRQEFISEEDFVAALEEFVKSEPEGKFTMVGDYELRENKGNWYSSFKIRKITRYVDNEDEDITASNMTIKMYITNESVNNDNEEKFIVAGYVPVYDGKDDDGNYKYKYAPITVVLYKNESTAKKIQGYNKFLSWTSDDSADAVKEVGFVCRVHNGSERVKLTYDMLSDEQKEAVDFELTTIEDIEREMNGAYGERKTDIEILKFSDGFSKGAVESALTVDDIKGEFEEITLDDDLDLGLD